MNKKWREWARRNLPGVPVVEATTYTKVEPGMEVVDYDDRWNPDRPVLMRGSIDRSICIHANGNRCANNYVLAVMDRYLRFEKYTSFDRKEIMLHTDDLIYRCKHHTTYHVTRNRWPKDEVYVNGHRCFRDDIPAHRKGILKSMSDTRDRLRKIEARL